MIGMLFVTCMVILKLARLNLHLCLHAQPRIRENQTMRDAGMAYLVPIKTHGQSYSFFALAKSWTTTREIDALSPLGDVPDIDPGANSVHLCIFLKMPVIVQVFYNVAVVEDIYQHTTDKVSLYDYCACYAVHQISTAFCCCLLSPTLVNIVKQWAVESTHGALGSIFRGEIDLNLSLLER